MTLLGPNGKPLSSKAVTTVHLTIVHTQPGGKPTKLPILSAELDTTDPAVFRRILNAAVASATQALLNMGALERQITPPPISPTPTD